MSPSNRTPKSAHTPHCSRRCDPRELSGLCQQRFRGTARDNALATAALLPGMTKASRSSCQETEASPSNGESTRLLGDSRSDHLSRESSIERGPSLLCVGADWLYLRSEGLTKVRLTDGFIESASILPTRTRSQSVLPIKH
jgi:hypothetical protein